MIEKICLLITISFVTLLSKEAFALAPLESIVLGNFSEQYKENETDPLFYVFEHSANLKSTNLRDFHKSLGIYRGFYEEGKNLDKMCKEPKKVDYVTHLE